MDDKCDSQPFTSTWSRWFFAAFFLLALFLCYKLVEPFLTTIFLAVVMVVVSAPLYQYFLRVFKGRRSLASGITCLLLILIIAIPFFLIAGMITSQALDLYNTVSGMLTSGHLQKAFDDALGHWAPYFEGFKNHFGVSQEDFLKEVGEIVRRISAFLYQNLAGILRGVTNILIGFALMLFVTFYLLIDGSELADKGLALSPLPGHLNQRIREDFLRSLRATLKGTVVLALIQGIAGGSGFWVFGIPNALFWGTVMIFASVVPLVGTALIWLPGGLYLMANDHLWPAVGMMVWCLIAGLTCDNILRPRLIRGEAQVHPLLTFFSVLGGLSLFGLVGLILGPLVLAVLLSLLAIYQDYFLLPSQNNHEPTDDNQNQKGKA